MFSELTISWRSDAGLHTLRFDANGVHTEPTIHSAGPAAPADARRGPARRGKVWSADEEATLPAGFAAGRRATELAAAVGRSAGAVNARLVAMGLLDAEAAGLRIRSAGGRARRPPGDRGTSRCR